MVGSPSFIERSCTVTGRVSSFELKYKSILVTNNPFPSGSKNDCAKGSC